MYFMRGIDTIDKLVNNVRRTRSPPMSSIKEGGNAIDPKRAQIRERAMERKVKRDGGCQSLDRWKRRE